MPCTTLAVPGIAQVGQEDVAAQVVVIEVAYHQHADGIVRVAVHDDCRPSRRVGSGGIECVQACSVGSGDKRVAQGGDLLQAVHPLPHVRVFAVEIVPRTFQVRSAEVLRAAVRLEGVARQVETPAR